jgi:hypothetical protein
VLCSALPAQRLLPLWAVWLPVNVGCADAGMPAVWLLVNVVFVLMLV